MRWTPCSEDLPKKTGRYYVTVNNAFNPKKREVSISLYSHEQKKFLYGDVVAWMPLQKPYMEDME